MAATYSLDEVKEHKTEKDCWIIIKGRVFDVTKYLDDHPGGVEIVTDLAGQDAGEDYDDVGHSEEANAILEKFLIGKVGAGAGESKPAAAAAAKPKPAAAAPPAAAAKPAYTAVPPAAAAAPAAKPPPKASAPKQEEGGSNLLVMAGAAVVVAGIAFMLLRKKK
jgi:hypothetical protein